MSIDFRKLEMENKWLETENEWLREQLQRAGEGLEMLKIDNQAHNELVERSARIMQNYFDMRRKLVEMSAQKEKLKVDKLSAEQREKDLEQEMERWIIDVNSERYSNDASIQRLSECLDKEKLYRIKSDVTREIVGKEREKIGSSFIEVEDKCKELEIESRVKEARIQELDNNVKQEKARIQELEEMLKEADVEIKLMANELEKEKNERKNIEEQKVKLDTKTAEGLFTLFFNNI